MSKEDPPPSPGHGLFDPTNHLLGPPPTSMAGGLPFPSLAHLPSAFSLLGRQPMFAPSLFGGLGALSNPLLNPAFNPAAGGADWWLAASEHARRLAGGSGLEFFAGSLGNNSLAPTFNPLGLTLDANQSGLEFLLRSQSDADKTAYLAGVQKHFVESLSPPPSSLKSSSKSAPSPTSQKRLSSSSSKRVTSSPCSTASSSASSHQVNGRSPTPTSATVSSKSTTSSGEGSRKRKQKIPKAVVPISSSVTKSSPLSIPSYPKIKSTFNSSKVPNQIPKKEQKEPKVDNGMLSDSDSHSMVSSGSSISDDSYADNITSDDERQRRKKLKVCEEDDNKYQITPHQIDGLKKQLLADQIRQRVQNKNNSELSPQRSPKNKERKPKNPKFLSQIESEDQLSQQEELKQQLEAELKQQKNRLRLLMKEAENQKSHDNSSTETTNVTKSVPPLKLKIPNLKFKLQPEANGSDLGEGTSKPQLNDLDKVGTTSDSETDSEDSGSSDDDSSNDSERDQSQGSQNDSRDNGEHGEKHSLDSESMDEAGTRKKRRLVTDESELRIPLEHSWSRQTTIHTMGRRGIVGEVLYFAPCGKKMRTIPDVIRYLDRHNITDLTRDNFTFNTKVNVGEFFELLQGQTSPVKLSEIEVMERIEMSRGKRARMQANARKKRERCMKQQALAKQLMELNMKRKLEQEELSQKAAEIKFQKRLERQRQKIQQRRQQQLKLVIERQKQQEQLKHAKQQEKVRKQEQLRMEREMKAQQILEEREMKRQQAVLMREQEKERRRQHLLLLKTLETRKKQEEREKLREERMNEKRILQERRMVQRQQEIEMARQLQRPMEDMELSDQKPFAEPSRIPGLVLSAPAYADCLMAIEFLHNFGDALGLDEDSLLTIDSLQSAMLNRNDEDVQDFLSLITHLLRFALEDPGIPNPREAVTSLGQKITDIEITPIILSEVLRIFIRCRNGGENELTKCLAEVPIEAQNPTLKARILGFLCDELVSSRNITSEIERNIDAINNMRRDKWIIEGKLRKLRITQVRKFHKQNKLNTSIEEDTSNTNMSAASKRSEDDIGKLEDLEDKEIDSGHESDSTVATNTTGGNLSEEEEEITLEECEKKIEKLTKQHNSYRTKVNNASNKLRTNHYGEDRYCRNYWVLPFCGGIFVEGLESADPEKYAENLCKEKERKEQEEKDGIKAETEKIKEESKSEKEDGKENGCEKLVKDDANMKEEKLEIKSENNQEVEMKSESAELKDSETEKSLPSTEQQDLTSEKLALNQNGEILCNSVVNGDENCEPVKKGGKTDTDSLIPNTPDVLKTSEKISDIEKCDLNDSSVNNSSTAHVHSTPISSPSVATATKVSTETKSSFMSIDSLLKKETSSSPNTNNNNNSNNNNNNNHFLPTNIFPPSPLVSDHYVRSYTDILDNRPWFSILPRMPCDDSSLTRSSQPQSHTPSSNLSNGSLSYLSLLPISPFNVSSPLLSSQLAAPSNNTSLDTSNMSAVSETGDVTNFKVPPTPSDTPNTSCLGNNDIPPPPHPVAQPIPLEQQKGWWRVSNVDELREIVKCLHCRGIRERNLVKVLQRFVDYPNQVISNGKKNVCKIDLKNSPGSEREKIETELREDKEKWMVDIEHELDLAALEAMESLESRIYQASLQVKGWKTLGKATENPDLKLISRRKKCETKHERHPLDVGKERLLLLESNIERRYLKPPLSRSVALNMANMSNNDSRSHDLDDDEIEHDAAPGLLTWRNVVSKVKSPAQLILCVNQLSTSISWEKSIMKVICEICRKDDNEAQLLLCDGCDKGYHTYCFKPKMEIIPDGDWYCYECISKASGTSHCIRCGKRTGKLVECDDCPRAFHIDCLDPPLQRLPKKWQCAACAEKKTKKGKRARKKSVSTPNRDGKDSDSKPETSSPPAAPAAPPQPAVEKKKKEPPTATREADMVLCKQLLSDMDKHDESWPFLQPVNGKQFPTYRKVIKHPMDFTTMKNKLRDNLYKSRIEFAGDAHLVFDNCVTFNEDDSEVGQAGHTMRDFFQKRYAELFPDDS
ncbi:hypothetical protein SNE40_008641 [Patella caerulea]|uniref:Bromodomain adjacent to zinc finger domain protein 2B n=1 Tax=Patella caerulea TaxID=87958 RepID=A0AAN8Q1W9_PATCE